MSELLICPFCGEQPEVGHYETFDNDEWYIGCDCECGPCTKSHLTYEQAVAAWNTRVERTCRNVCDEWAKTSFAGAETSFCCSECGAHYVDCESYYAGLADADGEQIRTNYCPNCGSRVIG